jgi:hypothetical protein
MFADGDMAESIFEGSKNDSQNKQAPRFECSLMAMVPSKIQ